MTTTAPSPPSVGLVVDASRDASHLERTLGSLRAAGIVPSRGSRFAAAASREGSPADVVVLAPCHGDGSTGRLARSHPDLRVLAPPAPIDPSRALALAARAIEDPYMLVLDASAPVDGETIRGLVRSVAEVPPSDPVPGGRPRPERGGVLLRRRSLGTRAAPTTR